LLEHELALRKLRRAKKDLTPVVLPGPDQEKCLCRGMGSRG
jgi:hypothetical protein